MTKHARPADPARVGPRVPAAAAVPVCAAAFALPAQRLRDLTRAELAAVQAPGQDERPADIPKPQCIGG